jgi:hypothetical protein
MPAIFIVGQLLLKKQLITSDGMTAVFQAKKGQIYNSRPFIHSLSLLLLLSEERRRNSDLKP